MLRDADIQAMIAQWRETFYRLAHPTKLGSTTFLIQQLNEAAPKMHPLWRSCRWPRNGQILAYTPSTAELDAAVWLRTHGYEGDAEFDTFQVIGKTTSREIVLGVLGYA